MDTFEKIRNEIANLSEDCETKGALLHLVDVMEEYKSSSLVIKLLKGYDT